MAAITNCYAKFKRSIITSWTGKKSCNRCYKDPFKHVRSRPLLVNDHHVIGTIDRRYGTNDLLQQARMISGDVSNCWITVNDVIRLNGQIIDDDLIICCRINDVVASPIYNSYSDTIVEITNVLNVAGIEFDKSLFKTRTYNHDSRNDRIEQLFRNLPIAIVEGIVDVPQLSELGDEIVVPSFSAYNNSDEYYETIFHELAHYVRFNHLGIDRMSIVDPVCYAVEEIIAEMAATKLAYDYHLNHNIANSTYYVQYYLRQLATWNDVDMTDIAKIEQLYNQCVRDTDNVVAVINKLFNKE